MKNKKALKTLSILMSLCILCTAVLAGAEGIFAVEIYTGQNWMSNIPENTLLSNINIPGTHDSGMTHAQWFTGTFCITQSLNIKEQLDAGARIFDLRLRYAGSGEIRLCHGAKTACCDAKLDDSGIFADALTYDMVLSDMYDFIIKHDSEVIIATTQHEWEAPNETDSASDPKKSNLTDSKKDTEKKYIDKILYYDPGYEYLLEATDVDNPKNRYIVSVYKSADSVCEINSLRKLDEEEYAVVPEQFDKDRSKANDYKTVFYQATADSEIEFTNVGFLGKRVAHRCDLTLEEAKGKIVLLKFGIGFGDLMEPEYNRYSLAGEDKWLAIKPMLDSALPQDYNSLDHNLRAAYTSCTNMHTMADGEEEIHGLLPTPDAENASEYVNPRLLSYNFEKGKRYGWFSMDYITPELCEKIYKSNSYEEPPTAYYISDIRGFCGDDNDEEDLTKTIEACKAAGYTPVETNGLINVNPYGYNMVIGYKTSTNIRDAITDVIGAYGDNGPENYTKVITKNSMYNYFTRGSGSKSEDTYLYYIKELGKTPITGLMLSERACGNVSNVNGGSFNLNEGLGNTIGISVVYYDEDHPGTKTSEADSQQENEYTASILAESEGFAAVIISVLIIIAATSVVIIKKKKK